MKFIETGNTTCYQDLTWMGDRFDEDEPNLLWDKLPHELALIALAEATHGNIPNSILENRDRDIVVLGFVDGPTIPRESTDSIRVHTNHEYGNYCYDDTNQTLEHLATGCFLAFDYPVSDRNAT